MNEGANVYILGNLTDELTGEALDRELDKYREAENQLACFGYGVLSPHHLPANLRGWDGFAIRFSMIEAADFYVSLDDQDYEMPDFRMAAVLDKTIYTMNNFYNPRCSLRSAMGVEKIKS